MKFADDIKLGEAASELGGILANRRGVSHKVDTTISTNSAKFQQSQKKKLCEYEVGSPTGKKC